MPDLTLDFRPDLAEEDTERLLNALGRVGRDDTLTIVLPRRDAHEAAPLFAALDEADFDYQTKGGHEDEFYVSARRRGSSGPRSRR
jgi:hypothetical protein